MTVNAIDDKAALGHLDAQIEGARELANAEAAFSAANGNDTSNPWANASRRLDDLQRDREQLALRIQGEKLNALLAKRQELNERLDRLQVQRQAADRVLAERAQDASVVRYRNATGICMREGFGHSWEIFRKWYESGLGLRQGAPECSAFFLSDELAKSVGVSFDLEGDRAAVRLWIEALDTANRLLSEENSYREELRNLLREHPELQATR